MTQSTAAVNNRQNAQELILDDLVYFAHVNYGVEPELFRTIVASLYPLDGEPCWIINDTDPHVFWEDFREALQSVGVETLNVSRVYAIRPRYGNQLVDDINGERGKPRMLFRTKKRKFNEIRSRSDELENQCLRLQLPVYAVRLPKVEVKHELTRRLNAVLRPLRGVVNQPWEMNDYALTVCELLAMMNRQPAYMVCKNVAALIAQNAAIHGRAEPDSSDHLRAYRVIRDSIDDKVKKVVQGMADGDGARTVNDLQCAMGEWDRKKVRQDMLEAMERGIIRWLYLSKKKGYRRRWARYADITDWGREAVRLVRGRPDGGDPMIVNNPPLYYYISNYTHPPPSSLQRKVVVVNGYLA